jgi:Transglutaminase-like superfamily
MFTLACRAYLQLIRMDLYLARGDFFALYERVRLVRLRKRAESREATEAICRAVDIASVWYWKQVPCLQRSAAATCLLRRHGVAAELVIGAQCMPFRAHAWVEVERKIVNDKPYISDLYAVLDRC